MPTRLPSHFNQPLTTTRPPFLIDTKDKSYSKQYANLYWLRLVVLRKRVQERAERRWKGLNGEL